MEYPRLRGRAMFAAARMESALNECTFASTSAISDVISTAHRASTPSGRNSAEHPEPHHRQQQPLQQARHHLQAHDPGIALDQARVVELAGGIAVQMVVFMAWDFPEKPRDQTVAPFVKYPDQIFKVSIVSKQLITR